MKLNQNMMVVVVVSSCLALPVAARQAQTDNDGRKPLDGGRAAKVDYKNLEKADEIIGMAVADPQEHKLGKVKDLAIDMQDGRVAEVIIGSGGFAGLDEKMIAVPPEALIHANAGKGLQLNDADAFRTAPSFKMSHWNAAASATEVADVYERFHVTPHGGAGELVRADKIMGLTARNPQNERLGKVENLVVDLSAGRVVEVMIASGRYLGIKEELSAVPPQAFRYQPEKALLTLDTTKETLKYAPHFKPGDWRNSADNSASLAGVYNAYGVPPYFTQGSPDTTPQNIAPKETTLPANTGGTLSDETITSRIQVLILTTDGLSMGAREVRVTTQSGRVTLRGIVSSEREKKQVGDLAATVVEADHVDNQIEVRDMMNLSGMSGE